MSRLSSAIKCSSDTRYYALLLRAEEAIGRLTIDSDAIPNAHRRRHDAHDIAIAARLRRTVISLPESTEGNGTGSRSRRLSSEGAVG